MSFMRHRNSNNVENFSFRCRVRSDRSEIGQRESLLYPACPWIPIAHGNKSKKTHNGNRELTRKNNYVGFSEFRLAVYHPPQQYINLLLRPHVVITSAFNLRYCGDPVIPFYELVGTASETHETFDWLVCQSDRKVRRTRLTEFHLFVVFCFVLKFVFLRDWDDAGQLLLSHRTFYSLSISLLCFTAFTALV